MNRMSRRHVTPIDGQTSFDYRVLATSKTSTMQKELQEASDAGFEYRDQTVLKSTFGGQEVVCILERDKDATARKYDYKRRATTKTSSLEKELRESGVAGYEIIGMTVSKTAMGGKELVAITRRGQVMRRLAPLMVMLSMAGVRAVSTCT